MMSTVSKQKMDDMGRILIPKKLRKMLDIGDRDNLSATYNPKFNTVVLQKVDLDAGRCDAIKSLDDYGRVVLNEGFRKKVGWMFVEEGDTIAVSVCLWTSTITLSLYEKYNLKCIFCNNPEIITKVKDVGVCKYCATAIARDVDRAS